MARPDVALEGLGFACCGLCLGLGAVRVAFEGMPISLRFYCSRHMHGNFVMQKVIQTLPPNALGFMIYELKDRPVLNSHKLLPFTCLAGERRRGGFAHLCLPRASTLD